MDHHVVAQHPYLRAAFHQSIEHVAARHRTDLGDAEHLAHLDQAEHLLALLRREHPRERSLDLVDRLVNDVVVADVDARAFGKLSRRGVCAHVETDDHCARSHREVDVRFGDAAHAGVDHAHLDLFARQARERMHQGFLRTLHVGLDDQRQSLFLALAHFFEDALEAGRPSPGEFHVAELALSEQRDLARLAFVGQHCQFLPGIRYFRQPLDLHRDRGTGRGDVAAVLVEHCAHPAVDRSNQHHIAAIEGAGLDQHGGHRAAALVEPRFDHDASSGRCGRSLEFEHLGLQQYLFEQFVDALPGLGRYRDERSVAAELLRHYVVLQELLLHFFRVGFVLVDLVDRDHQRHFGGLCMVDCLDRLGHHTVVRCDDEDHQVGDFRPARAHRREGFVARGIEEGNHATRRFNVVGPDVLGNSARLAGSHLGAANVVEQRGLAMVNVAHHGDHGWARLACIALGPRLRKVSLGIGELRGLGIVPHLLDDDHSGLLVEHLIDRDHGAELHHHLDDLGCLDRHLVRQLAHRDGFGHRDLAHDRLIGGGGRRDLSRRLARAAMVRSARPVPAAGSAGRVAARLDGAALCALVLPDRDLLFLRLLVGFFARRKLGLVQRSIGAGKHRLDSRSLGPVERRLRFPLGRLLFGVAFFALLPLAQFRRLQFGKLPLALVLFFAQCRFPGIDDGTGCRRGRLRHRGRISGPFGRVALDEDALLADLDLDGARLAGGVGFLDLAGLLARQRDLGLHLRGPVRAAQVIEQSRLVALAERVLRHGLVHAGRAQLLEQHRRLHLELTGELGDARLGHVTEPPAFQPAIRRRPPRRTSAPAQP